MNFKTKLKNFWRLNAQSAKGFTLVELIVVIAILAIVAGIAVPAYSGYVEKAKKAEDEQLLAAINTAFAAACIENGTDVHSLTSADEVDIDLVDGKVDLTSVTHYAEEFKDYYAGNYDAKFSEVEDIYFSVSQHAFDIDEVINAKYGDGYITLSAQDIEKLNMSTFIMAEDLGVANLLGKVDYVAGFASAMDVDEYVEMFADEGYLRSALASFGIDTTDMEYDELTAAWQSEMESLGVIKFKQLTGKDLNTLTVEEQALYQDQINQINSQLMANTAVLFAAQNSSGQSQEQILTMLTGTDPKTAIINSMNTDKGTGLSQAAMAYGLYTAYAYSLPMSTAEEIAAREEAIASTDDPLAIIRGLEDEGFQAYLKTEQAKTDLDGYMSAMNMINDSSKNDEAVANLLVNGFADEELVALLQQSLN